MVGIFWDYENVRVPRNKTTATNSQKKLFKATRDAAIRDGFVEAGRLHNLARDVVPVRTAYVADLTEEQKEMEEQKININKAIPYEPLLLTPEQFKKVYGAEKPGSGGRRRRR